MAGKLSPDVVLRLAMLCARNPGLWSHFMDSYYVEDCDGVNSYLGNTLRRLFRPETQWLF